MTEGSSFVGSYTKSDKGTVSIDYDLAADTWFYAYPKSSSTTGSLEIYSLKVVLEALTSDLNSDGEGSCWATFYSEAAGYTADAGTIVYTAKLSSDKSRSFPWVAVLRASTLQPATAKRQVNSTT
ncbi:MAG: hypothetical protein IJ527_01045 [Prevotella sp.]|nr:hypothetical protein [Prevotella sp.]